MRRPSFLSRNVLVLLLALCLGAALPAVGMAVQTLTYPLFVTYDDDGNPMGGCLYTYAPGTTTAKTTYSNRTKTVAHTNPIIADSRGDAGPIYFDGRIKATLGYPNDDGTCPTSPDVVWTKDNLEGQGATVLGFHLLSEYTDGDADGSILDDALTALGSSLTQLYLDADDTLAESLAPPATLKLIPVPGSEITLGAYSLTIGQFDGAGHVAVVFVEASTGTVEFGAGAVEYVLQEWWGTNAAALQNAINCAIASDVPLKGLSASRTIASAITAAGNFDWLGNGCYSGGTEYIYTGTGTFIKTTAKLDDLRWDGFRVSTTGSSADNVDIFDFDLGVKHSTFSNITLDLTTAARHGWIVRGQPAAGGAANNWQYTNTWTGCTVSGNDGTAWWGGTDLTNGGFNDNTFIGCTTGTSVDLAFHINAGNGNTFINCEINENAGTYSAKFGPDTYVASPANNINTFNNSFLESYFDGTSKPVLINVDTDVSNGKFAPVEFIRCIGITYSISDPYGESEAGASKIHDYEGNGTDHICFDRPGAGVCETVGARIVMYDSKYHYDLNTLAGNTSRGYNYEIARSGRVVIRDDGGVRQTRSGGFADDYDGNGVTDVKNWAALLFGQSADAGVFRYAANDLRTVNGDSFRLTNSFFGQGPGVEATLNVGGHLTITSSAVIVDTYADAATDDCIAISGGLTGDIIVVRQADSGRDVTLKDYAAPGTPGMINTYAIANAGAGYATNDVLTVVQTGGSLGTITVLTVNAGTGAIETSELTTVGTGYEVENSLATTVAPAGGTGATVNITAVKTQNLFMPADCPLTNVRDMAVFYQRSAGEWNLLSCSDNN